MAVPVAIFLAFNAGHSSAHGWGVAMSTDTAFALGMLALVGPRFPDRLRAFMLTVVVVDDVLALVVIATVYSGHIALTALLVAVGIVGCDRRRAASGRAVRPRLRRPGRGDLGGAPQVGGRSDRRRARDGPAHVRVSGRSRRSRARVGSLPALPRAADARARTRARAQGLRSAISANERLQQLYHPWTSYVIVPLFALANAGIAISGGFLSRAYTSPVTLGVLIGYVVGKPVGIAGTAWVVTTAERWAPAPAGGLGARHRRGCNRRDRLHDLDPDRDARLPRRAARGGEARRAVGRVRRVACDLARVQRSGTAAQAAADSRAARHRRADHRPRRTRSTPSAITFAGRRRRR